MGRRRSTPCATHRPDVVLLDVGLPGHERARPWPSSWPRPPGAPGRGAHLDARRADFGDRVARSGAAGSSPRRSCRATRSRALLSLASRAHAKEDHGPRWPPSHGRSTRWRAAWPRRPTRATPTRGRWRRSARASAGGWAPCGSRRPTGRRRCAASRRGMPRGSTPPSSRRRAGARPSRPGEGLPGRVWRDAASRPGSRTSRPTTTSRAPRRRGAPGLHAAFCFPHPQRPRRARRDRVLHRRAARARRRAAGDHGQRSATRSARRSSAGATPEALRAKEARHRAMLDAALDCVVTMDHEGRVVDFNPAAERTFGYRSRGRGRARDGRADRAARAARRHRRGLARYLGGGPRRSCSTAASRSPACAPTARRSRSS